MWARVVGWLCTRRTKTTEFRLECTAHAISWKVPSKYHIANANNMKWQQTWHGKSFRQVSKSTRNIHPCLLLKAFSCHPWKPLRVTILKTLLFNCVTASQLINIHLNKSRWTLNFHCAATCMIHISCKSLALCQGNRIQNVQRHNALSIDKEGNLVGLLHFTRPIKNNFRMQSTGNSS